MITQNLFPKSLFEVVRDQVFFIILSELISQLAISISQPDADYEAFLRLFMKNDTFNLWKERYIIFSIQELCAINVYWMRSAFPTGSQILNQKSNCKIMVDVQTARKGTSSSRGDILSSETLDRMLGIIRKILMHGNYLTLGLPPKLISSRWVNDIDNFRPQQTEQKNNSDNIISGNLSFTVDFNESNFGIEVLELLQENYSTITGGEGAWKIETENLY